MAAVHGLQLIGHTKAYSLVTGTATQRTFAGLGGLARGDIDSCCPEHRLHPDL